MVRIDYGSTTWVKRVTKYTMSARQQLVTAGCYHANSDRARANSAPSNKNILGATPKDHERVTKPWDFHFLTQK